MAVVMDAPDVSAVIETEPLAAHDDERGGAGPRPVFVVGSLRSGASLLTLCLGQHPHLHQTLETGWFERFAVGLQQAYADGISPRETSELDVTGVEIDDFYAHFGEAIDRLMRCPRSTTGLAPTRWLDGSQSNTRNIPALLRLFPQAQVIHVVREAADVVATLTNQENRAHYKSRQILMSAKEAGEHWLESVSAGVEAEWAFGSATVLRVWRRDLVERPEETLRRCLDFVGEPFDPACLRPFLSDPGESGAADSGLRGIPADLEPTDPPQTVNLARSVSLMSRLLVQEGTPNYARNEAQIVQLEIAFAERCAREARLVAGPKGAGGRGARAGKPANGFLTTQRNGKLYLRLPDLGGLVRGKLRREP